MEIKQYRFLDNINSPDDLKSLRHEDLHIFAAEVRHFLIETLNGCGGHLAGNLGCVELTLALHSVFNCPTDAIVWDVGHQAYVHKLLTGRKAQLASIRKWQGLSPFPKRDESPFDAFGVGHSSTSISAALGMAVAQQELTPQPHAIAVIGDGGLTGGMAFEALNHAGTIQANLLIVLNDNDMSISQNVGALSQHLRRIISGKRYHQLRQGGKSLLQKVAPLSDLAKKTESHIKGMITPSALFETLGIHYVGPLDGHDLDTLIPTLTHLKSFTGPCLLHIHTKKGKGYRPAEIDPITFHGVSPGFKTQEKKVKKNTYSHVFGQWLCDTAAQDPKLMAITPAMSEGSGMVEFSKLYPKQFFDVAIAEQHALTFAAGLACANKKPVVAIYATFLQRGYDQFIHDIALQNLDVTFAVDRAGVVGPDGPTHAGSFDLSFLQCIPNVVILTPSNAKECTQMLNLAYQHPGPAVVRYPRGDAEAEQPGNKNDYIIGQAHQLRQGEKIALLAFGSMVTPCLQAAENINATVVHMGSVKPLDINTIMRMALQHEFLVVVEENTVYSGVGCIIQNEVQKLIQAKKIPAVQTILLGLPDQFLSHGTRLQLLRQCGLDAQSIESKLNQLLMTCD